MLMAVKIFCCYAHEDEPLLKKLKTHLFPLQRAGLVDVWYDRDISAGTDWEQQIKERLNAAHIILLLVSPDFMASDYCYSIEMQRAMERHEKGEARVIPIILRRVLWQGAPFSKLQALPTDGKPVKSWLDEDEALFNVVKGVRKAIDELSLSKSSPINTLLEETTKQETTTPSITHSETPPIVSPTSDQVSQSNHVNSTQQSAQTNVTDLPQTLTDFDPAKQRNDEQYAEVI